MFLNDTLTDPTLRDCVVFLLQDRVDADTGESIRTACATASIVCVQAKVNRFWMPYVVTARHCYEKCDKTKPLFARMNTKSGGFEDVEIDSANWEQHHSTDVAIAPIRIPHSAWVSMMYSELLLSEEEMQNSSIKEGHDVTYISLFSLHHGKQKNLPLTRRGSIALLPREKVSVDLGSLDQTEVDAYLIETHSWGGQSGAPVFVQYPECIRQSNLKASPLRLLGLISGHFEMPRDVKFSGGLLGEGSVKENSGISIVIPAQAILDLLQEDLVAVNREKDATLLEARLREAGFLRETGNEASPAQSEAR